jgi:hypothetical protein
METAIIAGNSRKQSAEIAGEIQELAGGSS